MSWHTHTAGNKTVIAEDAIAEDVHLTHKYLVWSVFPVGFLFASPTDFDSQKSIIASESNQNACQEK
jgi:hypothetical protein